MLVLMSDPRFFLLLTAVYVVGFVDADEPTGCRWKWEYVSILSFWGAIALALWIFVADGPRAGAVSLAIAWLMSVAGVRRGVIAQRNAIWESVLWTTPLQALIAIGASAPKAPVAKAKAPQRRPVAKRVAPSLRLPSLADLLPARGRRLTIAGIAMDLAACGITLMAMAVMFR
jgi:hypothetical protein